MLILEVSIEESQPRVQGSLNVTVSNTMTSKLENAIRTLRYYVHFIYKYIRKILESDISSRIFLHFYGLSNRQ